jgi:hypothetical protein
VHHGVVDVADHHEAAGLRWHEQLALGLERTRAEQLKVDRVPQAAIGRRYRRPQMHAEVAVLVSRDPLLGSNEARNQRRSRDTAP